MLSKIIVFVKQYQHHIFLGVCIILISFISYNLGQIRALKKTPIKVYGGGDIYTATGINSTDSQKQNTNIKIVTTPIYTPTPKDQRVVASKNSKTKLYHFTWCSGAKKIKSVNQVWFDTAGAAQAAGYTLAGNCNP